MADVPQSSRRAHISLYCLDIIGDKELARAASSPSHMASAWDLPPAGGGRRGEAEVGEQTGGLLSVLCPPPNLPPAGGGVGARLCSNAHDVSFLLTIMSSA